MPAAPAFRSTPAARSAPSIADLGLQAGASGNADIEGAGSELNISNNLNIGDAGLAVLTVGNGATLAVTNNLNESANGYLIVSGGQIDPANGTLSGSTTLSAGGLLAYTGTLTLNGSIVAQNGTGYLRAGTITGAGSLVIGSHGDLVLQDGSGGANGPVFTGLPTPSIAFSDGTGTLTVSDLAGLGNATITSFVAGDIIDLPNITVTSTGIVNTNTLELFGPGGTPLGELVFNAATVSGATLAAGIQSGVACFVAGTRIATDRGSVAVEDIRIGDTV